MEVCEDVCMFSMLNESWFYIGVTILKTINTCDSFDKYGRSVREQMLVEGGGFGKCMSVPCVVCVRESREFCIGHIPF